jgi:hypothetical protein
MSLRDWRTSLFNARPGKVYIEEEEQDAEADN